MGVVHYDTHAAGRRLEAAFPLHTEDGMKDWLERIYQLDELRYLAGDFDITLWLVDFYEVLMSCNLSQRETEVVYFLYFEGYKQSELVQKWNIKKNTVNTLLSRAVAKLANYYAERLVEDDKLND